jgi:hypothetical protein
MENGHGIISPRRELPINRYKCISVSPEVTPTSLITLKTFQNQAARYFVPNGTHFSRFIFTFEVTSPTNSIFGLNILCLWERKIKLFKITAAAARE